jgi:glyoxylase-like metal-dependent hydrolase (beta-lactamase superfamily II)
MSRLPASGRKEDAMQIVPGLHEMGDKSGGYVRAFLVDDGTDLTLIDTLLDRGGKLVLDELKLMGRQPSDIKRIVLSHAHQSHLGGLAALKKLTGATVYAHDWEAPVIEGKRKVEVPKATTLWPQRPLQIYTLQVAFVLGLGMPTACHVDRNLKDGDRIGSLTVMHTPGHTPGSLSFYWPEKRALIVGDIVVTWPSPALGWPQITLDNAQNKASVGKLSDNASAEIVCVGHGDTIVQGGSHVMKDLVAGREVHPVVARSEPARA